MDNADNEQRQQQPGPDQGHWLYRRRSLNVIFWGLILVCAALGLADLFYQRKTAFDFESFPAAYGIFGFVSFFGIVLSGWWLRKLVGRDEDYYDR